MARVVIRDKLGRFMKLTDRYTPRVAKIQVVRNREYLTVSERALTPKDLANVLNHREFESLPEALVDKKTYTSSKKYKVWDIADQVDRTKGVRRKQLKFTVTVQDGQRVKHVTFYHNIKRNTASSYAIFRRINQELGLEGMFLYDKTPDGHKIGDRTGRQVKLVSIKLQEII